MPRFFYIPLTHKQFLPLVGFLVRICIQDVELLKLIYMQTIKALLSIFIIGGVLFLVTCTKEEQMATMTVKLTNTSAPTTSTKASADQGQTTRDLSLLTAINLDVQECQIHYYGNQPFNGGWVSLNTYPGVYNLMGLDTDATAVLVNEVSMPMGTVTQMRLKLGNHNTIVIDGVIYPLKVPSGEESGLKIQLKENILFTNYITVILAFDPYHSIVELGNGGYILKPVIQVDVVYQL